MFRASSIATAVSLVCIAAPSASAFVAGNLHRASPDCLAPSCGLLERAQGDHAGAASLADSASSAGSADPANEYAPGNGAALLADGNADALVLSSDSRLLSPAERGSIGLVLLVGSWLALRRQVATSL